MRLRATRLTSIANAVRNLFGSASLNLNFTGKDQQLDPRITFSRASNATVTGPDGTLQYAPHNLLTFSEQFDAAAWLKANSLVTANAMTAPDGSLTADLFAGNGSGAHYLYTSYTATAGIPFTVSCHVKNFNLTGLAEVWIRDFTEAGRASFSLSTGTVGTSTGIASDAAIVDLGNGWFRISAKFTPTVSGAHNISPVHITNTNTTTAYYVWGAQLNVGPLQPYYPTTVKNLLGFTQEFDNAAWAKSNSFVQTNLLTWSEQFDNPAWGRTGITVTANAAVAPDGTTTADLLAATLADCTIGRYSVATSAGTLHTASVWMRADTPTTLSIFLIDSGGGSGNTNAVCNVTTTWQRFTVQRTTSAGTTTIGFQVGGGNTFSSGESVYIWGAQLVQGSTPGDYQRTEGTARAVMYPAPDGSRTADKLVENTAASIGHFVQPFGVPAYVVGETRTISVYAKAAERTFLQLVFTGIGPSSTNYIAGFNLENGTAGTPSGGQTSSIISVGDGWYSCSLTVTAQTAASATHQIRLALNSSNTPSSYTGDGASGIYIWGAQLSDSASLDPYVYNPGAAPTAAAYYGPRFDYDPVTLAPKGLLIEEQRTNQIRNNTMQGAVAGTPGTLPTNWNLPSGVVAGLTSAVVDIGAEDGIPYLDFRLSGTPSATTIVDLAFDGANVISASNGQSWTQSNYVKLAGGSTTNAPVHLILTGRDSSGAFVASQVTTVVISPTADTLKSQRQAASLTMSSASVAFVQPRVRVTTTAGLPIDITLRIGMPQLELGAFATSVIPTTTAAATRAADVAVMTGANFSNWYRQDEGTLFAEWSHFTTANFPAVVSLNDGSLANRINLISSTTTANRGAVSAGGATQADINQANYTNGTIAKGVIACRVNDFAVTFNGAAPGTDSSGVSPVVSQLQLFTQTGGLNSTNGHIRKIAYFPRRLSNAELQGVTS